MKKDNFCRIIETEDGSQVLLVKDYDQEEDGFVLRCSTRVNGNEIATSYGDKEEAKVDAIFENYTQDQAEALRESAIDLLER